jgi:hypothetical protein
MNIRSMPHKIIRNKHQIPAEMQLEIMLFKITVAGPRKFTLIYFYYAHSTKSFKHLNCYSYSATVLDAA